MIYEIKTILKVIKHILWLRESRKAIYH